MEVDSQWRTMEKAEKRVEELGNGMWEITEQELYLHKKGTLPKDFIRNLTNETEEETQQQDTVNPKLTPVMEEQFDYFDDLFFAATQGKNDIRRQKIITAMLAVRSEVIDGLEKEISYLTFLLHQFILGWSISDIKKRHPELFKIYLEEFINSLKEDK